MNSSSTTNKNAYPRFATHTLGAGIRLGNRSLRPLPARAGRGGQLLSVLLAALATTQAFAQPVRTIEEIVITAEQNDYYDVLPDRETGSVTGTSQGMDQIARSVTLVESELVDLLGIRSVNDFVSITPGSFTGNYFGVPGALDLRGERADNFFRGFRRIENRGNFPTSVMAADFIEIIKGPPPVIYGGGKVGGILNFEPKSSATKTAQRKRESLGALTMTYGSYDQRVGSAEFGVPFEVAGKESSVYVFAQVENSNHFYDDIYNKNKILQMAFETQLSDTLSLEYGGMAQDATLNQSLGWNRVTQELIDSEGERYLSGQPSVYLDTDNDGYLSPAEVRSSALEQFAFASPFPYGALTAAQQAAFALDPATVKYVGLDHQTVQTERSDFSSSEVYTGYFDVIYGDELGNWSLKNQTFYDMMDHTKYSSYGFTADYDIYAFENKTTFTGSYQPTDALAMETVLGVAWRKSNGIEMESRGRGYQVLDRRDISLGATPNDRFEGAYTGTGNVPYNWVQDGEFTDAGAFALVNANYGERVNFVIGTRWDQYDVEVFGTDTSAVYANASDDATSFSYNISTTLALTRDLNFYATRAASEYLELGQGGMVPRQNVQGGTWLQDSDLTEIGFKGWMFDRRLYFSVTGYQQEKSSFNKESQAFDYYESEGVEIEARYAATEELSFTAAATKQETMLLNAPFFLGITPGFLGLDPELTYGGRFVAVGGLVGITGPLESPIPESLYSLNGIYTSSYGWGASLGLTWVDSMDAGYSKAVVLPSYLVARGALFYDGGNYSVRLNANNIFDEKYYTPQFLFWDTFISPSIGRTAELTVTYKW